MSTVEMRKLKLQPDVLVLGAQKCATTWLYECLAEHPDLFLPSHKRERDYLASAQYEVDGLDAYWRRFEGALPRQKIVDVSVDYIADLRAPAIVQKHLPEARLMVSLRNPVDRALSAHSWYVRTGKVPDLPLEAGIRRVIECSTSTAEDGETFWYRDIFNRGLYDEHLRAWLACYPADRFLVVLYDEIALHPARALRDIYQFCNVDPAYVPRAFDRRPKVTTGFVPTVFLERFFPARPGRRMSLLGRATRKSVERANELLARSGLQRRPSLAGEVRAELAKLYEPHVRSLQQLLSGMAVVKSDMIPSLPQRWR